MANIKEYKRHHNPLLQKTQSKFVQGMYSPVNTSKVIGGDIIYRSSWEYKLCAWCDRNENVLQWGCECVSVEYRDRGGVNLVECRKYGIDPNNPTQWPIKNYYIDFYIKFAGKNYVADPTDVKIYLIEVKPYKETIPPEQPSENAKLAVKKRFNNAAKIYLTNKSKWEAALAYAERNGVIFQVWDEHTLKKIGIL